MTYMKYLFRVSIEKVCKTQEIAYDFDDVIDNIPLHF
jgi:hypothetical protein